MSAYTCFLDTKLDPCFLDKKLDPCFLDKKLDHCFLEKKLDPKENVRTTIKISADNQATKKAPKHEL